MLTGEGCAAGGILWRGEERGAACVAGGWADEEGGCGEAVGFERGSWWWFGRSGHCWCLRDWERNWRDICEVER